MPLELFRGPQAPRRAVCAPRESLQASASSAPSEVTAVSLSSFASSRNACKCTTAALLGWEVNHVPQSVLTRLGIPSLLPRPSSPWACREHPLSSQADHLLPHREPPFWLACECFPPFAGWVMSQCLQTQLSSGMFVPSPWRCARSLLGRKTGCDLKDSRLWPGRGAGVPSTENSKSGSQAEVSTR